MANNSINYQQNAVFAIEFLWKLEYCKRDAVAFTVSKILRDQKRRTPKFWDFDGFFFFIRFLPAFVNKS